MTYTAALIGAGRIGRIHADLYANTDGIELTAIAEVDDELRETRGEEWGIDDARRYADHGALLATEELDVVSVAVPSALHRRVVVDAAESPADPALILCEKPMAESAAGAAEMIAACDEVGAELVVDHTLRFSKTYRLLRRYVTEDRLGTVHSLQLHAGGSLMRLGTHYVDLCSFLLDDCIAEVRGGYCAPFARDPDDADYDDRWGATTLLFDGGAVAQVDLTRSGSVANQLTLVGDEGMVVVRGSDASSIFNRTITAEYWRIEDGEHVPTDLPEPIADRWAEDMGRNTTGSDADRGMYAAQRQFDALGEHLVAILDGDEVNRSPGSQAAHVVEALVATFVSDATGSAVSLPLADSMRSTRISSR